MNDLTASLAQDCKDEGIDITPSALTLLAEAAEGSQDYAERLLEQLVSSYATPLTEEHVRDMLQAKHQPTVARDQQTPSESHTKKLSAEQIKLLRYSRFFRTDTMWRRQSIGKSEFCSN